MCLPGLLDKWMNDHFIKKLMQPQSQKRIEWDLSLSDGCPCGNTECQETLITVIIRSGEVSQPQSHVAFVSFSDTCRGVLPDLHVDLRAGQVGQQSRKSYPQSLSSWSAVSPPHYWRFWSDLTSVDRLPPRSHTERRTLHVLFLSQVRRAERKRQLESGGMGGKEERRW